MNFEELFDFSHRVTQDTVIVKTVNGQVDQKVVKGSFNWLGGIFTWFYAVLSVKYRTPGFGTKILVPFALACVVNLVAEWIISLGFGTVLSLAEVAWFGIMYDTWFKNQLLKNGYTEQVSQ